MTLFSSSRQARLTAHAGTLPPGLSPQIRCARDGAQGQPAHSPPGGEHGPLLRRGKAAVHRLSMFVAHPHIRGAHGASHARGPAQYLPPKRGNFVDSEGTVLAEHAGIWRYTIGQGAKLRGMKERMFVAAKDPAKNEIMVVPGTCVCARARVLSVPRPSS